MFFVDSAEQVTLRTVVRGISKSLVEAGVKGDGIKRHLNVDWSGELGSHTAHTLARGTLALSRFPLNHQHVLTSGGSEVIGNAGTNNPSTDDDDFRSLHTPALYFIEIQPGSP